MSTSFLSREEMHERVDVIFDELEETLDEDDEPVAVVGSMIGNLSVNGPNGSREHFEASPKFGYASFSFPNGDALALGNALRSSLQRELAGTVVVPKSDLHPVLADAIDGDEDAREKIAQGEVEA